MTHPEIAAALLALHDAPARLKENDHVCLIWEDGEYCMTKCGSLLGQRRMILIEPGTDKALPASLFPVVQSNGHGFLYCAYEAVESVRAKVLGLIEAHGTPV